MADIKLFKYGNTVSELKGTNVVIEKEIQNVIEENMDYFFGVCFLRSEWTVDNGHRRMDSIGLDENNCPVIFEYKRQQNENVINQGLYYLNWLLEHKADFKLLVMEKKGKERAEDIDWSMPRVICIAGDFNKYDEEAIKQINRNIDLIRYTKYPNEILMFEKLNSKVVAPLEEGIKKRNNRISFKEQYNKAPNKIKQMFDEIKEYGESLSDDVYVSELQNYIAFKKIKSFASMIIIQSKILLNLKLNPDDYNFELNETLRDIRNIGHWGIGDLQFIITKEEELNKAKELLEKAYSNN